MARNGNGVIIPIAPLSDYTPELLVGDMGCVWGKSGVGKSTFASQIPGVLLLNFEGDGCKWLRGHCPVLDAPTPPYFFMNDAKADGKEPDRSWEWWAKSMLRAWGEAKELSVLAVDTLDTYYTEWGEAIWNARKYGEQFIGDLEIHGKDYNYLKVIMTRFMGWIKLACTRYRKSAVILAHENSAEATLNLPGKAPQAILAKCDWVARARVLRNGTRVLDFSPRGKQEVKIRHPRAQQIAEHSEVPLSWDALVDLFSRATLTETPDPLEVDDADYVDDAESTTA